MAFHQHHLSQAEMAAQFGGDQTTSSNPHHQPNWLTSALLTSSAGAGGPNNFLNLHSVDDSAGISAIPAQPGELTHNEDSGKPEIGDGETSTGAGDSGGGSEQQQQQVNWQNAKFKAEILAHPLYEQLLSAHVACLRIATPVDQLPRIDAQLALSQNVVAKYSALGNGHALVGDDKELYQFMVYDFNFCLFLSHLYSF